MTRWYLIAGLVVATFLAFWGLEYEELLQPNLPPELSDRPNLYLENARISQFGSHGLHQYTISSKAISQHAATGHSTLVEPSLTFLQPGESAWYIYSKLGEIKRHLSSQNAPPSDAMGPRTSIHFTGQVRLSRGRNNQTLMELHGESLTIFPELKRVESNEPVIIKTSSSNVRAASFECDLEQNFLQLRSSTDQRVHFVILPKTRI